MRFGAKLFAKSKGPSHLGEMKTSSTNELAKNKATSNVSEMVNGLFKSYNPTIISLIYIINHQSINLYHPTINPYYPTINSFIHIIPPSIYIYVIQPSIHVIQQFKLFSH